jgi:hypothetical protein
MGFIVNFAKKQNGDPAFFAIVILIQTQENSFKHLNELKPDLLAEQDFNTIMKNAKKSWPDNYEMQLHEFETQEESAVTL